jgi:hypothetical protein
VPNRKRARTLEIAGFYDPDFPATPQVGISKANPDKTGAITRNDVGVRFIPTYEPGFLLAQE